MGLVVNVSTSSIKEAAEFVIAKLNNADGNENKDFQIDQIKENDGMSDNYSSTVFFTEYCEGESFEHSFTLYHHDNNWFSCNVSLEY